MRAQAETGSVQVRRQPSGIIARKCDASHAKRDSCLYPTSHTGGLPRRVQYGYPFRRLGTRTPLLDRRAWFRSARRPPAPKNTAEGNLLNPLDSFQRMPGPNKSAILFKASSRSRPKLSSDWLSLHLALWRIATPGDGTRYESARDIFSFAQKSVLP
jgi:hypothetical protein